MKKRWLWLTMTLGAAGFASMTAQADLGIVDAESKNAAYSIYASDYTYGAEAPYEEGLKVEANIETTITLDSQDPCVVFYHHDNYLTPEIYFGRDGKMTLQSYSDGYLNEHPQEKGKISAVYYLKPAEECGMELTCELYDQDYDTCISIEEKNGNSFLAAVHLTGTVGNAERDVLVFVADGKADRELWWYLGAENTKAEITGVLPIHELSEEDYSVDVESWNMYGDVVTEWTNYNSGATITYSDHVTGIAAYVCEETGTSKISQLSDGQWDYYSISKVLPQDILDQIGQEEDEIIFDEAMKAMPEGKPTVKVYGLAIPDEIVELDVVSEAAETFEDLIKEADYVQISTFDGNVYDSYKDYAIAAGIEIEEETETVTEAETENATEAIVESELVTEAETTAESELVMEVETELETTEAATEVKEEIASETETELVAETEVAVESEPITEKETEVATETVTEAPTESEVITEAKLETEAETEAPAETELITEAEPETEAVTEAAVEVATEPAPDAEPEMVYSDPETILNVQLMLRQRGYDPGKRDGYLGEDTFAAINAFQEAKGLPVKNEVDDSFLIVLGLKGPRAPYSDEPTVSKIQKALADRGYEVGEIDGILGKRTYDAMAAFQGKQGLEVTEEITEEFLKELGIIVTD